MADLDLNLLAWGAVIAGIIATAFWRVLGVLLYHKIAQNSPLMQLINMLAYSLVGAVMMLLMINPSGILATTQMSHRIIGLIIGIVVLFVTKKLPIAIIIAIGTFGILSTFFDNTSLMLAFIR